MHYDNDDEVARATRGATLEQLAREQELIFLTHFPYPGIGHIEAAGDGFAGVPSG